MTEPLEVFVPGDEVIAFMRSHGAKQTDVATTFPSGRYFERIDEYVRLMEAGEWEETRRPIYLDARSGTVWQGTDRTMAISMVDWAKAPKIPKFKVVVEHPNSP